MLADETPAAVAAIGLFIDFEASCISTFLTSAFSSASFDSSELLSEEAAGGAGDTSIVQVAEQPSPSEVPPSSQVSGGFITELPHR